MALETILNNDALMIFLIAALVCVVGKWIRHVPISLRGRKIASLKSDIRKMTREAEAFNSPSTFSTYAKIHREIDKKKKSLDELQGGAMGRITESFTSQYMHAGNILKGIASAAVTIWWWGEYVYEYPQPLFYPLKGLHASAWILICYRMLDRFSASLTK